MALQRNCFFQRDRRVLGRGYCGNSLFLVSEWHLIERRFESEFRFLNIVMIPQIIFKLSTMDLGENIVS